MQAIEEILLESTLAHQLTEVAVGRRDYTNVHVLRPFRAERLDLAFLQDAQELRLQPDAHRSDLVEEDRAAIGQGEPPLPGAGGVRERPSDMPEELRLQQGLGNGRTVDLDERHFPLRAAIVHGAGDELLARAGLARDQHRAAGGRYQLDDPDHIGDGATATDESIPVVVLAGDRGGVRSAPAVSHTTPLESSASVHGCRDLGSRKPQPGA